MPNCPRCHFTADEADCYCRHCGRPLRPQMGFWYNHGGILLLTCLVGPFSLITVWLSRKISLRAKWLWTTGILLFSVYCVVAVYHSVRLLWQVIQMSFPA